MMGNNKFSIPLSVPIVGEKKMIKTMYAGLGEDGLLYFDPGNFNNLELIGIGHRLIESASISMHGTKH